MIRANCRDQFTAHDFEFIAQKMAKKSTDRVALSELLTDPETRDTILDHPSLLEAIVQREGLSSISPYLYFYVLVRKALTEQGIEERDVADYVACLLAEFSSARRVHTISPEHKKAYHYFVDMMTDFLEASSYEAFLLRSHMGNYALFMTGLFPDYVYRKATYGRKAPGFEYYEKVGSQSYRWAAQHRIADRYQIAHVLALLSERFRYVRVALNQLADEYLSIDERPESLDKMLRQIFFGKNWT
jgi:hypothetical protein